MNGHAGCDGFSLRSGSKLVSDDVAIWGRREIIHIHSLRSRTHINIHFLGLPKGLLSGLLYNYHCIFMVFDLAEQIAPGFWNDREFTLRWFELGMGFYNEIMPESFTSDKEIFLLIVGTMKASAPVSRKRRLPSVTTIIS